MNKYSLINKFIGMKEKICWNQVSKAHELSNQILGIPNWIHQLYLRMTSFNGKERVQMEKEVSQRESGFIKFW